MFVLTVDQVDSRNEDDRVPRVLAELSGVFGDRLLLAPERSAGDEFQALLGDARAALEVVLALTRSG